MTDKKPLWEGEKVSALRDAIRVRRGEELVPINQTDFGYLLGAYRQATISGWESDGCFSRRGAMDLDRVSAEVHNQGKSVWSLEKKKWE